MVSFENYEYAFDQIAPGFQNRREGMSQSNGKANSRSNRSIKFDRPRRFSNWSRGRSVLVAPRGISNSQPNSHQWHAVSDNRGYGLAITRPKSDLCGQPPRLNFRLFGGACNKFATGPIKTGYHNRARLLSSVASSRMIFRATFILNHPVYPLPRVIVNKP